MAAIHLRIRQAKELHFLSAALTILELRGLICWQRFFRWRRHANTGSGSNRMGKGFAFTSIALIGCFFAFAAKQSDGAPAIEHPENQWPGWRGPRGDGTSYETGIPLH